MQGISSFNDEPNNDSESGELSAETREILKQVEEAAAQLSPEQQAIFRMSKYEGKSYQAIGRSAGDSG